jgi:hypothetical protein
MRLNESMRAKSQERNTVESYIIVLHLKRGVVTRTS